MPLDISNACLLYGAHRIFMFTFVTLSLKNKKTVNIITNNRWKEQRIVVAYFCSSTFVKHILMETKNSHYKSSYNYLINVSFRSYHLFLFFNIRICFSNLFVKKCCARPQAVFCIVEFEKFSSTDSSKFSRGPPNGCWKISIEI